MIHFNKLHSSQVEKGKKGHVPEYKIYTDACRVSQTKYAELRGDKYLGVSGISQGREISGRCFDSLWNRIHS